MATSYSTYLILLIFIVLGYGCQSPWSKEGVNELSALDVRIQVAQDLTDKNKNEVSVFINDQQGRPVRNKSLKIRVNAWDLVYSEKQELYYTTSSQYSATDVPVSNGYRFEIKLSNGQSYFLGSISALAENGNDNVVCPERGNFNEDFVISWKNLKDINQLSATKGVLSSTSTALHQNLDHEPLPGKVIGASGKYTILKATYITPKSTIRSLDIKFVAARSGIVNSELAPGSRIEISGHIDRFVEFDGQQL
jgi:hypothetical protein